MPNIEIYGFSGGASTWSRPHGGRQAWGLREIIEKQIQSIGLENEAVVTVIYGSIVASCDEKRTSMPFIRVCSTDTEKEKIERIVKAFKEAKIGFDVETLILNSFIPKDEMK